MQRHLRTIPGVVGLNQIEFMPRILLVDDDEIFRGIIHRMLTRAGYEVQDASNGREGLDIYRRWKPDVVLTDLIMPEMEGFETIMGLRKLDTKVKVIAMSGGGRIDASDYLGLAAKLGASRTLEKPFEFKELVEALTHVLGEPPPRGLEGDSAAGAGAGA